MIFGLKGKDHPVFEMNYEIDSYGDILYNHDWSLKDFSLNIYDNTKVIFTGGSKRDNNFRGIDNVFELAFHLDGDSLKT